MIQFQTSQFKEVKEVQGSELKGLQGWTLVAILQEKQATGDGGETTITKYVLGKDETTVVSDLQAQVDALKGTPGAAGNLAAQLAQEKADRQAASATAASATAQINTLQAEVTDLESQVSNRDLTISDLQADLAKIRAHYGDAEIDGVLAL